MPKENPGPGVLTHYYIDPQEDRPVEVEGIELKASDGWNLRATLHRAKKQSQSKVPGVILLAEPGLRVRTIFGILAEPLALAGFVVLSLDMRGSAGSHGDKDFEKFSAAEKDKLQLDIRAAILCLSRRKDVDANRIAILAGGINANYTILETAETPNVRALVLMTADQLSSVAKEIIRSHRNLPILTIVGQDQPKHLQRVWSEPYFLSEHRSSQLMLGIDQGPTMLFRQGGMIEHIINWLSENVAALPIEQAIAFSTSDGWNLSGTIYLPQEATNSNVPAVVFAHGLNHSEQSWADIPARVAMNGVATLAFDLRGTRKSINPGKPEMGVGLSLEELQGIYLDVKAAVDCISSQEQVDGNRIGIVSATAICNHAVRAAFADERIKTLAMLTFYTPDADVQEYLKSNDVPLFVIASTEDVNPDGTSLAESSRIAYECSKCKRSQLLLYDDAGRGNGMPHTKPEITGMLSRWLAETLQN